ncbi:unnamed protein product [Ilex paraguariensis]|uniref:Uncharacterized protein n=1 Tax=Ilex paraguariensis TaxID=185542 RepID=A0ABC8RGW5_9AQUA
MGHCEETSQQEVGLPHAKWVDAKGLNLAWTDVSGTERMNDDGTVEIKVETVDYRSPAGDDEVPKKENVEVTHLIRTDDGDNRSTGKVMADADAAVTSNLQSAKEAISGESSDEKNTT